MRVIGEDLPDDFDAGLLSPRWTLLLGSSDSVPVEDELRRECGPGHPLHGKTCRSVAIHVRRKESVFWLPGRNEWAIVHLTWTSEIDPRWPSVEVRASWAAVIDELVDQGRF